ncbi:hypothetical protein [Vibrio alginolyticus]|uniref:hypothetical protein n=1 Tax=Vibrio alginolyticus TaxID=663 RepID=UPI001A24E03F|nr:hypothetical protein [Vibrio parahaemolyticus]HAS6505196.1 hypothetical protein [Vibrio parahaemolyticus]
MPLTELRKLITRFKQQKDDAPIALGDSNSRTFALHELLDMCSQDIHLFIMFDRNGESELFEALADEVTSRKMSKHLDLASVHIATNDTSKIKELSFVERSSESAEKRLHINPIPKKLTEEYQQSNVDNDFALFAPEHLMFLGRYAGVPGQRERLSEVRAFLNFYDKAFYETLLKFFMVTLDRASTGEFR